MNLYTKLESGNQIVKSLDKIVIVKDGFQIFNPTEEMLSEAGWEKYEPSTSSNVDKYEQAKLNTLNDLLAYDTSNEVNVFYVNNLPIWLDKATRVGLKLRFEAELESAKTETTLWYMGNSFALNLDAATKMLNAIEIYASKCYDQTQYHLSEINKLTSIEEIRNYDYKVGYPEKLQFNF